MAEREGLLIAFAIFASLRRNISSLVTYPSICFANGGERGIRTLGGVSPTHPFQGCTIGHSVISPLKLRREKYVRGRSIENSLGNLAKYHNMLPVFSFMIWLYRTLSLPFLLLSAPYYLKRMWRRGGYKKDWQQRLGYFPQLPKKTSSKKRLWIQAVSVGEVLALAPLIRELTQSQRYEIILTTTTSTGYHEALNRYSHSVLKIALFPIDFWPFSKRAWQRVEPDAVLLTESELWPEHLHRAKCLEVPVLLINARLSDRSFKRFQYFKLFSHWALQQIDAIICSTGQDFDRFLSLKTEPLPKVGNLKVDVPLPNALSPEARVHALRDLGFDIPGTPPFVLIGASTWELEEAMLLSIQKRLIACGIACLLIIVPRHAERRNTLLPLLERQSLPWSYATATVPNKEAIQIFLSDTTGQLTQLLRLADLAFIGKSMPPNQGGQTPIEAAGLGIPSVFGPNMSNFASITEQLVQLEASKRVDSEEALFECVQYLIKNPKERLNMGLSGISWHKQNQGICSYICKTIERFVFSEDASSKS